MSDHAGRIFGILAALAVLWIVVYWWWEPSSPRITFDNAPVVEPVSAPLPREPVPEATPTWATLPPEATGPETIPAQPGGQGAAAGGKPESSSIAVVPPRFREYTVKDGDTLEGIARRELGSSRYVGAIREANPLADLDRLRSGRVIRIPVDPENIQGKPVDPPKTEPAAEPVPVEYTVRPGDTLSGIAKRHYGSVRFAEFIYEANRGVLSSPDDLREGQKLKLPPKPQ